MKPTQITELFANIRNTFVSFFSILMFVALGVGIFLGITWAAPALQNAANGAYDRGSFRDIQVQFSYGLTDDDLKKLADVEGVTEVEPARQSFQQFSAGAREYTAKVQTMGAEIDVPSVVEGELPGAPDEVALSAYAARDIGVGVGDVIAFKPDAEDDGGTDGEGEDGEKDEDGMKYLNHAAFKVTGLVESPEYLANSSATYGLSDTPSGSVDIVVFALPGAFDGEAFQDGYPIANVRCDALRGEGSFSDAYEDQAAAIKARIAELGDGLALARYDDLHGNAQEKLDDAKKQLADAKKEIEDGTADLDQARTDLDQARTDLDQAKSDGEAQLASSRSQLSGLERQRAEAAPQVAELQSAVASAEASFGAMAAETNSLIAEGTQVSELYRDDPARYAEAMAPLVMRANGVVAQARSVSPDLPDVTAENYFDVLGALSATLSDYRNLGIVANGEATTINELQARLDQANAQLAQLEGALDSGWSQYYGAQATLDQRVAEGEQQIADGEQKIIDGEADIAKARLDVADAEAKVADNQDALDKMKEYDWTVSARYENAGAAEVSTFSDVTNNLSFSMAALFVIVGLLVSYSAVSRIVHEQITQIGTKKALGLRSREITLSFLAYSAIAVVAGAIIGTIVGVTVVEGIIGHVLGGMFFMGDYPPYFGLPLFLVVTALEIVLVLGATWFACHTILREHAVELLKGEKPPEAKTRIYEKWAVWERLPLFTQTIVNNCMNDKRRVFSTVVGVAGCTALIVTAITLNNDVLKSYDKHYEDVYGFNLIAFADTDVENAADNVLAAVDGADAKGAKALRKNLILMQPDGKRGSVRVIVPENPEAFSQVYHVNAVEGDPFDPDADGAWVAQAYASKMGAKVGDVVKVDAGDGVVHEVPIRGFYEFWLTSYEMVMGSGSYEREFDADLQANVVLTDSGALSADDVEPAVSKAAGFYSLEDDKTYQHENFGEFASVSSAVVAIYLALAALMAVVVLLNLNVMFIDEKKRELIVLMINGFSVKDAKRYIYNDTIVLTAIGIVLGLVIGCVMGAITVGSVEPSTAMFVKSVDPVAVVVGVVGGAVLAVIMSVISLRRIPRFELTDINKF